MKSQHGKGFKTPQLGGLASKLGGRKVFVGLSGGVDSSVSAALLKAATPNNFEKLFGRPTPKGFRGYDVHGVFIKVWEPDWLSCTSKEDRLDAMRVCAKLEIPFHTLNLEKEYKKEVVDYMIAEYKAGRTPNPDVMCNKHVKFGAFYKYALANGADYVATGHYARADKLSAVSFQVSGKKIQKNLTPSTWQLKAGLDLQKDQSYFLWNLKQEQLKHILFPVGHLQKSEVRKLAKKFGLITAEKKDSQGLCFLGKVDIKDFLSHYVSRKPGKVLNEKGEVVGTHDGAIFYTIGERHGFRITKKTPNDKPSYVVSKNIAKNEIVVSNSHPSLHRALTTTILIKTNWINHVPKVGDSYHAQIRYHGKYQKTSISSLGKNSTIISISGEKPIAGQSIVFYKNNKCLGGGIVV